MAQQSGVSEAYVACVCEHVLCVCVCDGQGQAHGQLLRVSGLEFCLNNFTEMC